MLGVRKSVLAYIVSQRYFKCDVGMSKAHPHNMNLQSLIRMSKSKRFFDDPLTLCLPIVGEVEGSGESAHATDHQDMGSAIMLASRSLGHQSSCIGSGLIPASTHPIAVQIAVMYRGACSCLKMKLPAMPPAPLNAVTTAAVQTLFHWPAMLLA